MVDKFKINPKLLIKQLLALMQVMQQEISLIKVHKLIALKLNKLLLQNLKCKVDLEIKNKSLIILLKIFQAH